MWKYQVAKVKYSLRFPYDLSRFLYWIFFKPFTMHQYLKDVDPSLRQAAALFFRRRQDTSEYRSLILLAFFYIWLVPFLLGIGLGLIFASRGIPVNWLSLVFYLVIGIPLSLSFSLPFCVAFLLPFSLAVAILSSTGFNLFTIILFSFALGLAYGLTVHPPTWALTGGLVYGVVFGFISGPLGGVMIGLTFLAGYFRIPLYLIEALLSFLLLYRVEEADAARRWRFQPLTWDELIWFPLPGLDRHLRALANQNVLVAEDALALVKESFRQGWAMERAL
jgi:hypothetical protein